MGEGNWRAGARIIGEGIDALLRGPRPTPQELSTLSSRLGYASQALAGAEFVSSYTSRPGALLRLQRVRRYLGEIIRGVDGLTTTADIAAVVAAVNELQRIGPVRNNPTAAAGAFGRLFSGLGRLSSHLPPPLNSYSDFLSESGSFFTNMLESLDPAQRYRNRADGEGGAVDLSRPYRP